MAEAPGYVEGWTEDIEYDLVKGDPPAVFDASGMTPGIVITDARGAAVNVAGDVSWANAAASRVRYAPDAGDFVAINGPYRVHWTVTDAAGKMTPFPEGPGLVWNVFAL